MARVKNATFVGASQSEVEVDAPTFKRIIKDAQGDLALAFDKATGQHAETEVCSHDGTAGRGARLGIPWVNQAFGGRDDRAGQFGADLTYVDAGAKGADSGMAVDTMVHAIPITVPAGEDDFAFREVGTGLTIWTWTLRVVNRATFATLYEVPLTVRSEHGFDVLVHDAHASGIDGVDCIFIVFADTTQRQIASGATPDAQVRVYSLTISPARIRVMPTAPQQLRSTNDIKISVPGVSAPPAIKDMDATLFADEVPIHGYVLGHANRNKNLLMEFVTGGQAGGNAAYQLVDENGGVADDVQPSESRFLSHSGAVYSTDPQIPFHIMAQSFGAYILSGFMVVDAAPPVAGLLDWYGEIPIAIAATAHWTWRLHMPHFQAASSKLKAYVLAGSSNSPANEAANWKASWTVGASTTAAQAFSVISGTGSKLWKASHTALAWDSDTENIVSLRLGKTGAKVNDKEFILLGACLYFEP